MSIFESCLDKEVILERANVIYEKEMFHNIVSDEFLNHTGHILGSNVTQKIGHIELEHDRMDNLTN